MRVLFASREPFPPAFRGGAEASVDELARALAERGHVCEVVARLGHGRARAWHRVRRALGRASGGATADHANGYPTWRAPLRDVRRAFGARLAAARPDVVLVWNDGASALAADAVAAGVRTVVWVPDATLRGVADPPPPDAVTFAAPSAFLAAHVAPRLGRPVAVLRPLVRLERYVATERRPRFVTLVNPRASKGRDVALAAAAALPSRPFLFVASQPLPPAERAALAAGRRACPNVVVRGPARDMRAVYARTAVLLVPSQCDDASPRVVLEAHANGIPVVASDAGGIPEVSGGASVLLPRDASPARWAAAVERCLADPVARAVAADRSRRNAARPEWGADAVVDAFLRLASAAPVAEAPARAATP